MGQYLSVALAKNIFIEKDSMNENFEDIRENLEKTLDLSLYNIESGKKYFILEMKTEIFHKEIIGLMEEISPNLILREREYMQKQMNEIKNKNYEEMMEIAKKHDMGFCYLEGSVFCNDISYILDKHTVFCDVIDFTSDGKIFMECYYDIFYYLRNSIIKSLKSALKNSIVVTIIG